MAGVVVTVYYSFVVVPLAGNDIGIDFGAVLFNVVLSDFVIIVVLSHTSLESIPFYRHRAQSKIRSM